MKRIIAWFKRKWEDFKAWRRGETRVSDAPRGRVYARKDVKEEDAPTPPGRMRSKATATCEVVVTRANGKQEKFQTPVTIEEVK